MSEPIPALWPPVTAAWREWRLATPSAGWLHLREFAAATGVAPRGTLLVVHGLGEHGGRYLHVAATWAAEGWRVIVPDVRGHGLSAGNRCDCRTFDEYLTDLDAVLQDVGPVSAILGHSCGGLIVIRYLQTRGGPAVPVALTSPLLEVAVPISALRWLAGRVLSVVAPTTRFATGIDDANLTRDPEFLKRRRNDPFVERTVTARWYFAMRQALQQAHAEAHRLSQPLLVLGGAADLTTSPTAAEAWLARTASRRRETERLPEHVHELLNEPDWLQTAQRIHRWFGTAADLR